MLSVVQEMNATGPPEKKTPSRPPKVSYRFLLDSKSQSEKLNHRLTGKEALPTESETQTLPCHNS